MNPPELFPETWRAILRSLVGIPTLPEPPASIVMTQPVAVLALFTTVLFCSDDRIIYPREALPPPLESPAVDSDKGTRLMLGQTKTKLPAQHLDGLLVQFVGGHISFYYPKSGGRNVVRNNSGFAPIQTFLHDVEER